MRLISPLLKNVVYPSMSKAGLFHRTSRGGLAVVTYHGIVPPGYDRLDSALDGNLVTAETFRRQLRSLKANYDVVSPEDVLAWREGDRELPHRAVLLTCDDGLLNCLTDMLPVLREEGMRCLFFLTGSSAGHVRTTLWYEDLFVMFLRARAGQFDIAAGETVLRVELGSREQRRTAWWDLVKKLSRVRSETRSEFLGIARERFGLARHPDAAAETTVSWRRFGLLTASEVCQLAAAGMTIGAHTVSHPMLSQAPPELAYAEIEESRIRLEAVVQKNIWAFAYPFGNPESVTPQVLEMPRKAAFAAAFLNCDGGLGTDLPAYALPRVHVTAQMGLGEFEAHVSGFFGWLQRRAGRQQGRALVNPGSRQ
jgi:peptidoglycan/xylan/chitin deacetylase (PgdA/CDA1 family)